jgi:hemerythrin
MPVMIWNESLSVMVPEIDDQHRKLIAMINNLHEAMKTGEGRQVIGQLLNSLTRYTQTHFAAEEKLMAQVDYPDLAAHQEIHRNLIKQVESLKADHASGKLSISMDTMNFLSDWLTKHIQGTDKKYVPFLTKVPV